LGNRAGGPNNKHRNAEFRKHVFTNAGKSGTPLRGILDGLAQPVRYPKNKKTVWPKWVTSSLPAV
jgi:hypothetical protein